MPAARPLVLAALVAFLLVAHAAPAAAGDLDGLAFLSWSPDAVVDTLVAAGPGTHDLYLVIRTDLAPARFVETAGWWRFDPGTAVTKWEMLTTGNPVGEVNPGDHGLTEVKLADFDCRRADSGMAVARLAVEMDPDDFADGTAAVTPLEFSVAGSTRLIFADYDPDIGCVGQLDTAVIGPAVIVDAAVPAAGVGFGALKARYR